MTEWLWIFVGFTCGMWISLPVLLNFMSFEQRRWAKHGFIEIDGAIYRLEKLKHDE